MKEQEYQGIVKVQISLFSTSKDRQVLVYDEDNTIHYQDDATKEIIKAVGKSNKAFFYYTIEDKTIMLLDKAPYQDW